MSKSQHGCDWTRAENLYLREHFRATSDREMAKHLRRSYEAIGHQRLALGLRRTKEETAVIKRRAMAEALQRRIESLPLIEPVRRRQHIEQLIYHQTLA